VQNRIVLSNENANLLCNSVDACVDHTGPKSNLKAPDGHTSYEIALIHEHDLTVIAESNIRCLTCNVRFCGLCGKTLNPQIHIDGNDPKNDSTAIRIKNAQQIIS
jgi:hypothetical protein